MKNQIALLKITKNGSDEAVFLNGKKILSADPAIGEPIEMVQTVANSLSEIHGVPIKHIQHSPEEDWDWELVAGDLIKSGKIVGLKQYELHFEGIDADGKRFSDSAGFYADDFDHAVEQLLLEAADTGYCVLNIENKKIEHVSKLYGLEPACFHLMPMDENQCWIMVANTSIEITQQADATSVRVFPKGKEDGEPISSAKALFSASALMPNLSLQAVTP